MRNAFVPQENRMERLLIWKDVEWLWARAGVDFKRGLARRISDAIGLPKHGDRSRIVVRNGLLRKHTELGFWTRYADIWRQQEMMVKCVNGKQSE